MTPQEWDHIVNTNVTGAWLVCRAAVPAMLAAGSCRVLLLTSEAGWAFTPGVGAYNVTKSALNNLGASLAAECAARYPAADVQINVLIPGEARTEMNQGSAISPYSVANMALLWYRIRLVVRTAVFFIATAVIFIWLCRGLRTAISLELLRFWLR